MKKVLSLALALAMVLTMFGLASAESALPYAAGTELRMGTGYNNAKTGLVFDAEVAGEGITLADGKTYNTGDLKPTWVAIQDTLGIKFISVYQGNGASAEFDYWKEQMDNVDVLSGTAAKLSEAGEAGLVVNIAEYLDQMPNFKAYLDANPIVKLSITGNTDTGAIYFSPYFDGVNDIERMPLMRIDWVKKLLDGEGAFTAADGCGTTAAPVYQPYMPTSGKIEIETPNLEGTAVEIVTKDYDAYGNIVAKMNEKGSMTGEEAVNMLREYIDKTYNGYYGTERSNLFIGQNAAWDADELVALLRCVVSNAKTLNGTDTVQGLFSREDANNQRRVDMFRFAGHLFGVRGLESRQDYLYVDTDGTLKDARQEVATYEALARMNTLVQEGLISAAFVNGEDVKTKDYLSNDLGFMHYDYNQTQTIYNDDDSVLQDGEAYEAVMVPVALWQDGAEGGTYMRFTESWRSVKTDGWGISIAGVGSNTDKLNAALALIDYAYSPEGTIRMSYGPDEFIKKNDDGSYVTFSFNGQEMPEIADATRAELWEKASGNYTNYARQFLGSTLSFMKSQAFEFQCTTEAGREGAGKISKAIALGTIKHPELALAENSWYTSVPTILPTTKAENDELGGFTDLTSKFQSGKDQENILVDIIAKGFVVEGMGSPEEAAAFVADNMKGSQYLIIKEGAWEALVDYAAEMK
jgi:putative aldouronate transport system substrate-binding protein